MLKKTNKQTNKQNKHRKVIQKILSPEVWGKNNLTQTKSPIYPPPPPASTPQKSNGRPLFSEISESCASFQTRRTRRLVEKNNNNNNQNFLRGNLDLQGQCVCKQKKEFTLE